jgi:ligand-binding sensor domain-containing protein
VLFFYLKGQQIMVYNQGQTKAKNIDDLCGKKGSLNIQIFDINTPRKILVKAEKEYFIVDENLNRLPEYDFVNKYTINTLYFDKKGNLWICTRNDGVYLKIKEKKRPTATVFLKDISIVSLVNDKLGNLFIGNTKGELFIFRDSVLRKINIQNAPQTSLKYLIFTNQGNLFAAWKDIGYTIMPASMLYESKSITLRNAVDLNPENKDKPFFNLTKIPFKTNEISLVLSSDVRSNTKNNEGDLVIAVNRDLRIVKDSTTHWLSQMMGQYDYATSLTKAKPEGLWMSIKGLTLLKNNKIDTLPALLKKHKILTKTLEALISDAQGNLWGAPGDMGFFHFNPKTEKLNFVPELSHDFILATIFDAKNRLWVSTNNGIAMIDFQSETPFKYRFRRIDKTNGLPSNEIEGFSIDDSKLSVATSKGLSIFDVPSLLSEVKSEKSNIPLEISSIKINGKDTILRGSYDLSFDENNLAIDFAGLDFDSSKALRYEYVLQQNGANNTDWRT